MLIRYRRPWSWGERVDSEFDRIVNSAFGRGEASFSPAADVITRGADVLVTLAVPGVALEDVDVTVDGRALTVSGERAEPEAAEGDRVVRRGLRYGKFTRTFQLPEGVDADQVSAQLRDGLLTVRVSGATKPAPQPRKIAVEGAESATELDA